VEVVDGDTLFVGETEVRLKGVDAMEAWTAEGKHATAVMHGLALAAEAVICDLTGETTRDREVGFCRRHRDGLDLNRQIIRLGAALAHATTRATSPTKPPTPATACNKHTTACHARLSHPVRARPWPSVRSAGASTRRSPARQCGDAFTNTRIHAGLGAGPMQHEVKLTDRQRAEAIIDLFERVANRERERQRG
jgi:hypothetical protein